MQPRIQHPTGTPQQANYGWLQWRILWTAVIIMSFGLILIYPATVQAKIFQCAAGDVTCLITSIKQANAQLGNSHKIRLAAGIYTLTAAENESNGPNGLPSITNNLTIQGAGADSTILERNVNVLGFRLIHVAATGKLTLDGLTLRGGRSDANDFGGGLYINGGSVIISKSTLVNNVSIASGGGIYINTGKMTIIKTTFASNGSAFGSGGGLCITNGATVTITASTLVNNFAYFFGGGLEVGNQATVTITNTTVLGNSATIGGGGLAGGGTLTLINSTVARNSVAQGTGGGIYGGGTTHLLNSTIVENWGRDSVGGTFGGVVGSMTLQNTIIAHNFYDNLPGDCSPLGVTSLGDNLIGDSIACPIELLASDLIGDPSLGSYTDDGTPGNGHFPLLETSPAINAGNNAVCPKIDQLGEHRDKLCDIGAIEFQGMAVSSR